MPAMTPAIRPTIANIKPNSTNPILSLFLGRITPSTIVVKTGHYDPTTIPSSGARHFWLGRIRKVSAAAPSPPKITPGAPIHQRATPGIEGPEHGTMIAASARRSNSKSERPYTVVTSDASAQQVVG